MGTDLNWAVGLVSAGIVVFGLNLTRLLDGRASLRETAERFLLALGFFLFGVSMAGVGELATPLAGVGGFVLLSGSLLEARNRLRKPEPGTAPKELEEDVARRLPPDDRRASQ